MLTQDVRDFMSLFKGAFVNKYDELILDNKTNMYFRIEKIETRFDLYGKIISACSRHACKTEPYRREYLNEEYQKGVRDKLNAFLKVNFTAEEWLLIYTYLGNGCNSNICDKFIESNFDIQVIKDHEKSQARQSSKSISAT